MSGAAVVLDHMSQQMEALQDLFVQSDGSRAALEARLGDLAGAVDQMVARMGVETPTDKMLMRVAEGQERLIDVLSTREAGDETFDAESRMRLRSIDVQLLRILEELSAGRQESLAELRGEIANLTRTLRALGEQGQ